MQTAQVTKQYSIHKRARRHYRWVQSILRRMGKSEIILIIEEEGKFYGKIRI